MALPLHSHQSLLERGMSEGHEAAEQAQSPVKMFLALITVPIDPELIPAQIRLILLVASAFCRPIALWSIPARGWPVFFTLLVPYRCLTVSPDKRQALPKHWFPIDFYLSQLSLALSHPRCIYLQLSSLSSNHTSTKLRREWSHQHFKDISTAHKENTTCRTDSFSNSGFALERTRRSIRVHANIDKPEEASAVQQMLPQPGGRQLHPSSAEVLMMEAEVRTTEESASRSDCNQLQEVQQHLCTCLIREERQQMKDLQGPSFESNHVLLKPPVL